MTAGSARSTVRAWQAIYRGLLPHPRVLGRARRTVAPWLLKANG